MVLNIFSKRQINWCAWAECGLKLLQMAHLHLVSKARPAASKKANFLSPGQLKGQEVSSVTCWQLNEILTWMKCTYVPWRCPACLIRPHSDDREQSHFNVLFCCCARHLRVIGESEAEKNGVLRDSHLRSWAFWISLYSFYIKMGAHTLKHQIPIDMPFLL